MTAAALTAPPLPATPRRRSARRVLPGFNLTLGYTLLYLSLIVLIPLSALIFKTFSMSWADFWAAVSAPRVLASFRLTFGASLIAACVNVVAGLLVAWVLVRYQFPGKKIADALVDLPFALPTAVAGIALTALYAPNGWVGQHLEPLGIKVAFTPLGVLVATVFGKPGLVVDTHFIRLSNRLGFVKNETDATKIERELAKIVPPQDWTDWSHRMVWHGRRRCFARKPDCANCPLADLCPSAGKAAAK